VLTLNKIKNNSLRESFKRGLFKEEKKKEVQSSDILKKEAEDFVSEIDKAILDSNENYQEMIKRLSG